MYKELLQSVDGIEIFPLISLFIFLALTIGIVIWIIKLDKSYIKEMSSLPLADDENTGALKKELRKN